MAADARRVARFASRDQSLYARRVEVMPQLDVSEQRLADDAAVADGCGQKQWQPVVGAVLILAGAAAAAGIVVCKKIKTK